jgi:DNA-directed RNA polymerase specialized sigma24 family protein
MVFESMADAATWDQFEALRPELLRFARSLLKHSRLRIEADDLVQSVLGKLYAAHQRGALSAENPRQFAFAAVKHQFLDEVRHVAYKRRMLGDSGGGDAGMSDTVDVSAAHAIATIDVADLLSKLAPEERCFVRKVVIEELGVEEARKSCGWPPASPYYQLKLLLARLAKLVEEQ